MNGAAGNGWPSQQQQPIVGPGSLAAQPAPGTYRPPPNSWPTAAPGAPPLTPVNQLQQMKLGGGGPPAGGLGMVSMGQAAPPSGPRPMAMRQPPGTPSHPPRPGGPGLQAAQTPRPMQQRPPFPSSLPATPLQRLGFAAAPGQGLGGPMASPAVRAPGLGAGAVMSPHQLGSGQGQMHGLRPPMQQMTMGRPPGPVRTSSLGAAQPRPPVPLQQQPLQQQPLQQQPLQQQPLQQQPLQQQPLQQQPLQQQPLQQQPLQQQPLQQQPLQQQPLQQQQPPAIGRGSFMPGPTPSAPIPTGMQQRQQQQQQQAYGIGQNVPQSPQRSPPPFSLHVSNSMSSPMKGGGGYLLHPTPMEGGQGYPSTQEGG
jgi:hypothetical protein